MKSARFQLTLPVDLHKKIKVKAADIGVSMNQYILDCLIGGSKPLYNPSSGDIEKLRELIKVIKEIDKEFVLDESIEVYEDIAPLDSTDHTDDCPCLTCKPKK